jgi:protein BCP1
MWVTNGSSAMQMYMIFKQFGLLFQKIQVEFEGRSPDDADFHGIKQLLQQLFLKAHVNLSELADLIIRQNYVGSVVKVCNI